MKKNIIIVILSLLLVSCLSYLIYDKYFVNSKIIVDNENSSQEQFPFGYDINKINMYKNQDGIYASIKQLRFDNIGNATLRISGELVYEAIDNIPEVKVNDEVLAKNIVDIMSCGDGQFTDACFYSLDTNGDVYEYSFESSSGKYLPQKKIIETNIKRLITITSCSIQGCGWKYAGVTKDGEIVVLGGGSV